VNARTGLSTLVFFLKGEASCRSIPNFTGRVFCNKIVLSKFAFVLSNRGTYQKLQVGDYFADDVLAGHSISCPWIGGVAM
jgi:hypothetical protein